MTETPTTPPLNVMSVSALQTGRGLLEIAWHRKSLVGLGVVAGLVVGLLYYAQARPVYQSKAQVLVVKKRPDAVTGLDTRHLAIEDYVATHQTLIKSPLILERAIERRNLANLDAFASKDDLTELLIKSLSVTRNRAAGSTANNVLDLAFQGGDAAGCSTVLNAVIESYRDFLDETYRSTSEETLKLIAQARDMLQQDLLKQEADYRKFRRDVPVLLQRNKDGVNVAQERLTIIETKRATLLVRKAEIQGQMLALEAGSKKNVPREALLALASEGANRLEGELLKASEKLTLQNQLYPLLQEEQRLLEVRGENHPEMVQLRKRIEVARSFLSSPSAAWRDESDPAAKQPTAPTDSVVVYREYFRQQLAHLEVSEKLLGELYKEQFNVAKELTAYEMEDETFRTDISRKQKLYEGIVKRLQDVDLIKDVGGYEAKTIAPPLPGKKVQPSGTLVFPTALFLGALLGFGIAYLAETRDKSFRSIDEVRRRLALPVIGQVPPLKPAGAKPVPVAGRLLAPILCAHHRPKSSEAEAYRGVRTALYFSTRGESRCVVQVTSPESGDGKSTLAANLAVSVAQSGKRVLLVDADLRKPTVHKLFDLSARVGLASVIDERAEPGEAIQPSGLANLSILPCGPLPSNPAELLSGPRFAELLTLLREQFDLVIVDTPPLLAVTDPTIVASRVDGVVLTVRLSKQCRPQAERAKDILDSLNVNVLGVVVNDAISRRDAANYGYGYAEDYHSEGDTSQADGPAVDHDIKASDIRE